MERLPLRDFHQRRRIIYEARILPKSIFLTQIVNLESNSDYLGALNVIFEPFPERNNPYFCSNESSKKPNTTFQRLKFMP